MVGSWINKAALFELLGKSFLYVDKEMVQALVSGEYAEALGEILEVNGLEKDFASDIGQELAVYKNKEAEDVLHALRREYTRLYIGAKYPLVSPYAGTWYAKEQGVAPLLFVGKESMAIERFMRSCGVGQPKGTNEPLDHIGSELEFIQYLCLLRGKGVQAPEEVEVSATAYEEFYEKHFIGFAKKFAHTTSKESEELFYKVAAMVLERLPEKPL